MTRMGIVLLALVASCLAMAGGCAKPPAHPLGDGAFVTESRAAEIAGAVDELFRRRSWQLTGNDEQERTLADGTTVAVAVYHGRTMMERPVTVQVQYELGQPSQVLVLIGGEHDREAASAAMELENLLSRKASARSPRESRPASLLY
ncbi:MAG TPA: hypothetical protein PLP01_16090 [Phycisphaerae bacterium]|nr:hypothetical protein [Phycisphaerae bacterium]HOI56771.1 hypothetical protein [Phycisphaerae bacterium]